MSDDTTEMLHVSIDADTSLLRTELVEAERLAKGFASTLGDAFVGVAVKGRSLGDAISAIGSRLSAMALNSALKPLEQGLAGLMGHVMGGALGGDGSNGARPLSGLFAAPVQPFAKGGVIASPSYFPLGGGAGLMGERGAEAILPLARGPDGALGVRTEGRGSAGNVVINIQTPDPGAFRRSDIYLSGLLARAVARGQRGM